LVTDLPQDKQDLLQKMSTSVLTHYQIQGHNYEILNVPPDGSCFFTSLSVGMAYHNVFHSSETVRTMIAQAMKIRWEDEERAPSRPQWFHKLFLACTDSCWHNKFEEYNHNMKQNLHVGENSWGSQLEILMAQEVFQLEIKHYLPHINPNVWQQSCLNLFFILSGKHLDVSSQSLIIRIAQTGSCDFDEKNPNAIDHFVFLRPQNLKLKIHENPDLDFANDMIAMLENDTRPNCISRWRSILADARFKIDSHFIEEKNENDRLDREQKEQEALRLQSEEKAFDERSQNEPNTASESENSNDQNASLKTRINIKKRKFHKTHSLRRKKKKRKTCDKVHQNSQTVVSDKPKPAINLRAPKRKRQKCSKGESRKKAKVNCDKDISAEESISEAPITLTSREKANKRKEQQRLRKKRKREQVKKDQALVISPTQVLLSQDKVEKRKAYKTRTSDKKVHIKPTRQKQKFREKTKISIKLHAPLKLMRKKE